MSQLGVDGFRAERDTILTIAKSCTDDEWNAQSDCTGWAVRDVLAHLAATLHGVVDPTFMPDMSGGTENAMEA
ncbi:MAG TPA: maleylpyruvate isomerase N-terminal domain-containing protein, partial [Acidimicrobiia bacterium]|nr:maleylpyruvate isomerase N-terminal domain-containing protein [Acidimicrobiia bacterium]